MNEQHGSDFFKVPNITFDVKKLRADLENIIVGGYRWKSL